MTECWLSVAAGPVAVTECWLSVAAGPVAVTECWLSVAADSLSSPAVTPLSSTVGHVESVPSLWLLGTSP